ncbi:hypothetical protein AAG570_010464 [Ranatra chinensis]|uniref:GH18 domain-containing protein n=1 Tax=Ranatra chinensis TaxID=642074 RepID=A0ABD0ZAY5_9HEMI
MSYGKFLPSNINPFICTHLFYAFAVLDVFNDDIQAFDKSLDLDRGGYRMTTDLKILNPNLKVMLSVGGWNEGSANFSKIVANPKERMAFVRNSVQFLRKYNFDGIDLVWQYPTFREGSSPDDKMNFGKLIQEMKEEFERESNATGNPRLLLSLATSGLSDYIEKGYDVPTINKYVDFLNMVAYDYHSANDPTVFHHSSLYPVKEELDDEIAAQLNADSAIRLILSKGMSPEKVNLGIPTYGRLFLLEDPTKTEPGSPAVGAGRSVTIDEAGSINYYETRYALAMGLGGIMFWTIDEDDFHGVCHGRANPLIWAAREQLRAARTPPPTRPRATLRTTEMTPPLPTTRTTATRGTTNTRSISRTTVSAATWLTTATPPTKAEPRAINTPPFTGWRGLDPGQGHIFPVKRLGLPAPDFPAQQPRNSVFTFNSPGSTFHQNIVVFLKDEQNNRSNSRT